MDRALYIAMSGAKQVMRAQAVNANNLANSNTIGFKKDFNHFVDVQLKGEVFPSRAYVIAEGSRADNSEGQLISTGRALDIAVQGKGFIVVQAHDGGEAFTRAGGLKISQNGILTNGAGYPVLGNSGAPIAIPPAEKIEIGEDGTISILAIGQKATTLAVIDRIKLVNLTAGEFSKGDDGLFYQQQGEISSADATVKVISGFLESSNVNSVTEMINMISNARLFEAQIKMMKTVKENDAVSAKLLKLT